MLSSASILLLLLFVSRAVAYDAATLCALAAASKVTKPQLDLFRQGHSLVLRGISEAVALPLERLGNPQPSEMASIEQERLLAAALASRCLDADQLRDPVGNWCGGWDNAYDHYAYWRILDPRHGGQYSPERLVMVVLPREPLTLTLCGYPCSVVARTAFSSSAYPKEWLGTDLSHRTDLCEPEIHLDAGDALILDGTNTEGLGGLGGGHLIYRFEACETADDWRRSDGGTDAENGVLWSNPLRLATPKNERQLAMLQEFALASQEFSGASVRAESQ